MSAAIELSCPNCEKSLKVPLALIGKKVKCKNCNHPFQIPDPAKGSTAKPVTPAKTAAKADAIPPAAPAPAARKNPFADDEDEVKDIELIVDDLAPRCPFCAQELDPPDAILCIHCGFNSRTRTKADTKRVWAPDAMDWIAHLLPGIIALVIAIAVLVLDIVSLVNMEEWMKGGLFDRRELTEYEREPNKAPDFHVKPGAFITLILGFSVFILVPAAKVAYKRLVKEFKPVERVKK